MLKLSDLLKECWDCERDKEGKDFTHGEDGNAPMADGELRSIVSNASKLGSKISPQDNLPAWVLAKITIASENLASVARYIDEAEAEMSQQAGPGFNMMEAKKPSAGLSKKEKSDVVKKAKAGKDIGKKGKGFEKVAKAAGGGEKGQKIAAAAMWKNVKR